MSGLIEWKWPDRLWVDAADMMQKLNDNGGLGEGLQLLPLVWQRYDVQRSNNIDNIVASMFFSE